MLQEGQAFQVSGRQEGTREEGACQEGSCKESACQEESVIQLGRGTAPTFPPICYYRTRKPAPLVSIKRSRSVLGAGYLHKVLDHLVEELDFRGINGSVIDLLPLAPALYESAVLELAQVMGHGWAGHAKYRRDVDNAALVVAEEPKDTDPGFIYHLGEQFGDIIEPGGLGQKRLEVIDIRDISMIMRKRIPAHFVTES